ncbi:MULTISPECIES: aspartate ammonia-lyase [unclassified Fusibacter]|uniref:aspartate ammonia-lyase n=1 Tax=unclassified Fusibacter TaxID=2624464 RepID=UPI00101283B4|nr:MULTISPECIES: aspartate ammonia-lyase [unclassified Fusibacter]MCK8061661.1 aspartate ammonia-lyase [Fusibacter sp. A2]NPE23845.1 aspartate ammonia-lyase [Fusibacter sp. A1]RXV58618.1 aspartate ammonia-lyase [Fusibacter sp. A1]
MSKFRIEKDLLGERQIPNDAYYGIQTKRAIENFALGTKHVNMSLIQAILLVKMACAKANMEVGILEESKAKAILDACDELLKKNYDNQFVTDALQGGAGTSTNMNVNEVVANLALEKLGRQKGEYEFLHPLNDVNMSQSTNDVYPTALRIAAIYKIRKLADELAELQESLQEKEEEFSGVLKLGRTQLMDALPMMLGQEFGAYARAVSRDRWRIYKVEERLRQINLGGTAIGTGMNASQKYIYLVTDAIQSITGLGLARSEYPIDTTQNMDVFVEVSGFLKSAAVNLIKISNDLRLLASGPRGGLGEINLPDMQAGSTIMPGKVNPVIAEMMGMVSMKVIANDTAITMAASGGQLELNAFAPLIAESLLESLDVLTGAVSIFREKCVEGITANKERALEHLENSTALVTALVHHIGYDRAAEIAKEALQSGKTIVALVREHSLLGEEELTGILNPNQITNPGIPGR